MGPGRSLADLIRTYRETPQNAATKSHNTLQGWSKRYGWAERAEEYDARIEEEKNAYAQEILETGLALTHERVKTLKELGELLLDQLHEKGEEGVLHNLWLPDVKQIGGGEYAERVDIERYNSPLISDICRILDDLAKETGGRVQKQDITSGGEALDLLPLAELVQALRNADEELNDER
jgi:hypothetical protein